MTLLAPPSSSYRRRDKVHAMRPPLTLLAFQEAETGRLIWYASSVNTSMIFV